MESSCSGFEDLELTWGGDHEHLQSSS